MDSEIINAEEIQNIQNRPERKQKGSKIPRTNTEVEKQHENNKPKSVLNTESNDITAHFGIDWFKPFQIIMGNLRIAENEPEISRPVYE